jgi:hypothetical protein
MQLSCKVYLQLEQTPLITKFAFSKLKPSGKSTVGIGIFFRQ